MAKDKLIKARASDYDKAVLKALTGEFNSKNSIKLNESDMVRYLIHNAAKQYLSDVQMQELRANDI